MSHTRSYLRDAASNYLRMMATIVGTLFLTRAMALTWGVDQFGRWSLIMSVLGFALLLDLGLSNVALKAAGSDDAQQSSDVLSSIFVGFLTSSFLAAGALSAVLFWMLPQSPAALKVAVLLLALRATLASLPYAVFRSALYARGRMAVANAVQAIGVLVYSAAACWMLGRGAGIASIAALSLASTVLDSAAMVYLVRRCLPTLRLGLRFRYAVLRPSLSLGGSSLVINVAGLILLKTDPIIVKAFLPISQVALYAVALRIGENIFLLCKQLVNALTPHAIRAGNSGQSDVLAALFLRATRYVFAFGASLYCTVLVLGGPAIRLWLSDEYLPSATILNILMLAMVLSIPQLVGSNLMTFSGRHQRVAAFIGIGAVLNVLASIVFVHITGATGVAYGTLVTTLVIDLAVVVPFACRHFGIRLVQLVTDLLRSAVLPATVQGLLLAFVAARFRPASLMALSFAAAAGCVTFAATFLVVGISATERRSLFSALLPAKAALPNRFSEA